MNLLDWKITKQSLRSNIGRTVLTLSGILISTASIMLVVSLGQSVKKYILDEIDAFGTQTIQVEIKVPSTEHISAGNMSGIAMGVKITTLTPADARQIAKLPAVEVVAEGLMTQETVKSDRAAKTAVLLGTSSTMPRLDGKLKLVRGSFFDSRQERDTLPVAVLGNKVARDLFGTVEAVGEKIKIKGKVFRVVGVLSPRGMMMGLSFDDIVYLPVTTLREKIMGVDYLQFITVLARSDASAEKVAGDIVALLRQRHGTSGPDDDFGVTTMKEMREMTADVLRSVTALLFLLAAVSLLVGAVGIMNVMLVAVEERKKEIGLRKAVGATRLSIGRQFLAEAVVLAGTGAVLGSLFGLIAIYVLREFLRQKGIDIPLEPTWAAVLAAVVTSSAAGVVFGAVPAYRAAKVSPMEAIRR